MLDFLNSSEWLSPLIFLLSGIVAIVWSTILRRIQRSLLRNGSMSPAYVSKIDIMAERFARHQRVGLVLIFGACLWLLQIAIDQSL